MSDKANTFREGNGGRIEEKKVDSDMSDNWGNSYAVDSPVTKKNSITKKKMLDESDRMTKDDVMKELEDFVKPRR